MKIIEITEGGMGRSYKTPRSKPISVEEAIAFIKTHCSDSFQPDSRPIYRGLFKRQDLCLLFDGNNSEARLAANTESYTNILVDTLPDWQNYPKRSKSMICATDKSYARNYGYTYRVFPINGTTIGVCSDIDFWHGFRYTSPIYLNPALLKLSNAYLERYLPENPQEFWRDIDAIDAEIEKEKTLGLPPKFKSNLFSIMGNDEGLTLKQLLSKLLSPTSNGFKTLSTKDFTYPNVTDSVEVWLEGQSCLIATTALSRPEFAFIKKSAL